MSRTSEEYKSAEERKIDNEPITSASTGVKRDNDINNNNNNNSNDNQKAQVFSTGWMHTDITGHPFDTRGLYGPKGVKFTPAPGDILPDGRKVVQGVDDSVPITSGAIPPTVAPPIASQENAAATTATSHSSGSTQENANIWRPEPMKSEDRHKLAEKTRADAEKDAELARKRLEKELPNAPPMSKNDQRAFINRYVPVGSNGYFARPSFEEELSSHISKRNRMPAIERLERDLNIKMMGFIREWRSEQLQQKKPSQASSLSSTFSSSSSPQYADSPMSSSSLSSSSPQTKIVTEGDIKITTLPSTVTTSTFQGRGYNEGMSFAEHASQRAPINVIETHKAAVVDSSPGINSSVDSSQSAQVFEPQERSTTTYQAPFIDNDINNNNNDELSNRMAATNIGSDSSSMSTMAPPRNRQSDRAILGNEQAFTPELRQQGGYNNQGGRILNEGEFIDNRLQQESGGAPISVGRTPLGPSGSPYKSGVDSKYVDLNAESTGFMHKDVTGFPYDTRGIAGERGINADIALAERQRQAELAKANKEHKHKNKDKGKDVNDRDANELI